MTEVRVRALEVEQPIGRFYIGVMSASDLLAVSHVDMRRIEGPLDQYVGIQRSLNQSRVKDISEFIKSIDATFPTSVVLAVRGECAEFADGYMRLFQGEDPESGEKIPLGEVASILDGQHRVEGLKEAAALQFQVPVSIFVDADIADQAYIFATVNLAQTKVNKSLVYDLLDYATARSPQKSAHEIAVALDRFEDSPFFNTIKRLGTRTEGRFGETLAQATVVNAIIPLISRRPEQDRYALAKGRKVAADDSTYPETPLRYLWVADRDADIAKIFLEYFSAVRSRWPDAWVSRAKGHILPRTNGYRALMRLFKLIYLRERPHPEQEAAVVEQSVYEKYFSRSALEDGDFTIDRFPPGTGGETAIFNALREQLGV